jgi:hypothetical protein
VTASAIVEHISWCQKERRSVRRSTIDYAHRAAVLLERGKWLAQGRALPVWTPGPSMRTVLPRKAVAA